jgi:hypothetical protein
MTQTKEAPPGKEWRWEVSNPAELIRAEKFAVFSITASVGKPRKDGTRRMKKDFYLLAPLLCPRCEFLGWQITKVSGDPKKCAVYHVEVGGSYGSRCDCGDWSFRFEKSGEPCKHLLALEELLEFIGLAINKWRNS